MLDCWKLSRRFSLAFATTLFGILIAVDASGEDSIGCCEDGIRSGGEIGCLPPTPSPCVADGTCRPNQREWGYSRTRWRPWPGDEPPQQPTSEAEREADEPTQLDPFERPPAVKEDVRGPSKTKSGESLDEADAGEVPQALPEADPFVPAADPLPNLDLQGGYRTVPQQEDAPPALPQSLWKVSLSIQNNPSARQAVVQASTTTGGNLIRLPSAQNTPPHLRQSEPQKRVVQAVSERRQNTLRLVNPVATGVVKGNRQAIYHEATDRPATR